MSDGFLRLLNWRPAASRLLLVKRADGGRPYTVAVDLDGTLAHKQEPFDPETIGEPRESAREWLRAFRDAGARVIIHTVRGDRPLVEDWLEEHDIPYDHLNENPDQPPASSGKLYADAYWDDRAISAEDLDATGPEVLRRIAAHGDEPPEDTGECITIERTSVTLPEHLLEALLGRRD